MRRRCCWLAPAVMAKNAGTAAIGSTRKKVDVNATKENSRTGGRGPNIELQSSGRESAGSIQFLIFLRPICGRYQVQSAEAMGDHRPCFHTSACDTLT